MAADLRKNGIVTLLFTDLVGSTRDWEADARQMAEVIRIHDRESEIIVSEHGGWIFKRTGDGIAAAFEDPSHAIDCGCQLQLRLPLASPALTGKIRMGLFTGYAEFRDQDFFGPTLNRASRLMAVAHGGQILVSAATYQMASPSRLEGWSLLDLGEHQLKDIERPERVYQVLLQGLRADFPPVSSSTQALGNISEPMTSFVGRERELMQLSEMLERSRLVTLTGVGGSGKTRLALKLGRQVRANFSDGVWMFDFAPLPDGAFLNSTILEVLKVRTQPGQSEIEAATQALKGKRLLAIFDNCEHVLDAVAPVADSLLRSCDGLQILATSRAPLMIGPESVYPLPALDLPQAGSKVDELAANSSIKLFSERAKSIHPSFELTSGNATAVTELCLRLDGLPLAIELAAVRVKSMSVETILSRLGDRFKLLTGGSRTSLPRQQTLRALIDWSYRLLSEKDQALLQRLSVFQKGWELTDAEKVCSDSDLDELEVLDGLTGLVEKSLAVFDSAEDRYRLLETIRQYGSERLNEEGGSEKFLDRHAAYFCDWISGLDSSWRTGKGGALTAERITLYIEEIRAAMDWMASRALTGLATMAVKLHRFYHGSGLMREGVKRYRSILGSEYPLTVEERETLLLAVSSLASDLGNYDLAFQAGNEAVQSAEASGESLNVCKAKFTLGFHSIAVGRFQEARETFSFILATLPEPHAGSMFAYAEAGYCLGLPSCREEAGSALDVAHAQGRITSVAECEMLLARIELREDDLPRAEAQLAKSYRTFMEGQDAGYLRYVFEVAVSLKTARGQFREAAVLAGLLARMHYESGSYVQPARVEDHESCLERCRAELGEEGFQRAFDQGLDLHPEDAEAFLVQPATSRGPVEGAS